MHIDNGPLCADVAYLFFFFFFVPTLRISSTNHGFLFFFFVTHNSFLKLSFLIFVDMSEDSATCLSSNARYMSNNNHCVVA